MNFDGLAVINAKKTKLFCQLQEVLLSKEFENTTFDQKLRARILVEFLRRFDCLFSVRTVSLDWVNLMLSMAYRFWQKMAQFPEMIVHSRENDQIPEIRDHDHVTFSGTHHGHATMFVAKRTINAK